VSVVFADVSGSSQLYAERGDTVAFSTVSRCLDILESQVSQRAGRVFKRAGDAVLAVFDDVEAAVRAAAGMHQAMEALDSAPGAEGTHVRVGISYGMAVLDAGDVYGDMVNVAARLVALAAADEVVISGAVYDALPPDMRAAVRLIDRLVLKGRPSSEPIYEYLWKQGDATMVVPLPQRGNPTTLHVTGAGKSFVVHPNRPKLRIGRESDSDITIDADVVSRHHAEIAMRGRNFLLIDRSTNGTYVDIDGSGSFRIIRDELTLAASGCILVGSRDVLPIRFQVGEK
jgi:adenylate cyclase